MSSFIAKPADVERKWYVVDAEGKNLGRMASQIAAILRGKNKPTYTCLLYTSPATLGLLAHVQEKTPFDLSRLRGLVTMGAPLEKAACKRFLEVLTPNILNGYGTTETFWNSFLRPYDLPAFAGTVGGSCIDDEVRVVKIYDCLLYTSGGLSAARTRIRKKN